MKKKKHKKLKPSQFKIQDVLVLGTLDPSCYERFAKKMADVAKSSDHLRLGIDPMQKPFAKMAEKWVHSFRRRLPFDGAIRGRAKNEPYTPDRFIFHQSLGFKKNLKKRRRRQLKEMTGWAQQAVFFVNKGEDPPMDVYEKCIEAEIPIRVISCRKKK